MYYFIVNPNARSGRGRQIWNKLERQLKNTGVEYEACLTEKPGDAKVIAAGLTDGCREPRILVVVGGDGTVNEVLDGLSFCGPVTLGYIPAGSGNDLARSLKLPKRPAKCLKKILNPKYHKQMDYGVLSYGENAVFHRRFIVSAGIGMDAAVCHNLFYSKIKQMLNHVKLGKISYLLIGVKQLILAHPVKGYLVLDGVQKVEFNHIYFVSSHIHPFEGGGFKFAPDADCSDGNLEVCVVHQSAKYKLIPIMLNAFIGRKKKYSGMRHYRCRELEIHTDRPLPVHVDGENCFCQKDIQVRCIEKKIRIIV